VATKTHIVIVRWLDGVEVGSIRILIAYSAHGLARRDRPAGEFCKMGTLATAEGIGQGADVAPPRLISPSATKV